MTAPAPLPIHSRAVLVLGGARSGKSRYAQDLAEAAASQRLYLATGSAGDGEMAARIALHRAARGAGWTTHEEPLELAAGLDAQAVETQVVLVDCLTFWLSNLMFAGRDPAAEIAALVGAVGRLRGPVVFVANEVGGGIVPDNRLARDFRDWQGRVNQEIAAACGAVVLVTAGLPTLLKPAPTPNLRLS